ncbi:MAG: GDSL-type esterase/lipase family protein [Nanoarchaeota archaeon]|nr:GDSL-type esterase/lipase family protein [Nanoarchaeota archaeon]
MKQSRIIIFGDSITWGSSDLKGGWVHRLKIDLESKKEISFSVYNCGISGDNTQNLLKRFEIENQARFYKGNDEHIVIFAIGINDAQDTSTKFNLGIPLEEFKQNIKLLIKQAQKLSNRIILIGLTPVNENKTTPYYEFEDMYIYQKNAELYNSALEEIAQGHNLEFVSMFNVLHKDDLEDGLHPNSKGHEKMYLKIRELF